MPSQPEAETFARQWLQAWNSRDVERILALYAEDVELRSPVAARQAAAPSGVLQGKAALRGYVERLLQQVADLHLQPERVYAGVDSVVLCYRGPAAQVAETLELDAAGKVRRVLAHFTRSAAGGPQGSGAPQRPQPPAGPQRPAGPRPPGQRRMS